MGVYRNCVISIINLSNRKPVCSTAVYRLKEDAYFSWQFGGPTQGEDQVVGEDTLRVRSRRPIKPEFEYPQSVVQKVKVGILRGKLGFKFGVSYHAVGIGNLVYHVVLPEFCCCDQNSLESVGAETADIMTRETRQSVTWSASWAYAPGGLTLKLGLIFSEPNKDAFEKVREKQPRVRLTPKWFKDSYPYVVEIEKIADDFAKMVKPQG